MKGVVTSQTNKTFAVPLAVPHLKISAEISSSSSSLTQITVKVFHRLPLLHRRDVHDAKMQIFATFFHTFPGSMSIGVFREALAHYILPASVGLGL